MSVSGTNQGLWSTAVNQHPDRGPMILGVISFLMAFSTISYALRIWVRVDRRVKFGMDDAFLLVSYIFVWADFAVVALEIKHGGLGKPLLFNLIQDPDILVKFLKMLYAQQIFFALSVTVIKFSFLAMFWRLFPIRFMKCACIFLSVFFILWCFGVVIPTIFQCYPVHKMWNPLTPTGFRNPGITQWIQWIDSIPQLFSDICLFLLPIVEIRRLHASKGTKDAITGLFLLSSLSILGRVMVLVGGLKATKKGQNVDLTYELAMPLLWAQIEQCIGFICNCLPGPRPLLTRFLAFAGLSMPGKSDSTPPRHIVTIGQMGRADKKGNTLESSQRGLYEDTTILSNTLLNDSLEQLDYVEADETLSFKSTPPNSQHGHIIQAPAQIASNQSIPLNTFSVRRDDRWHEQMNIYQPHKNTKNQPNVPDNEDAT